MKRTQWVGRALSAALLAASLGACNYINVGNDNPNVVNSPAIDQLYVSTQLNSYLVNEGEFSRAVSVWLQQLAGTDRQFSLLDQYIFTESELDGEMASLYSNAGLFGIRRGEAIADSVNCPQCKALFEIQEAFQIGLGASFFGDLPYSEAVDPSIPAPRLDTQQEIYAALQQRLDDAIAALNTAPAGGASAFYTQMAAADLSFSGDRSKWVAAAYTLKARLYMHWVEAQMNGVAAAQTACGGDCIQKAIDAASRGIMSPDGNWNSFHSTKTTEQNLYYQFLVNDRAGYISAGAFGVDLLQQREDPRLTIYYSPVTLKRADGTKFDTIFGSAPGANKSGASSPNTDDGIAAADYNQPIVSCSENQFILAEANYYKDDTGAAQSALQAGVECQNKKFGVDIPVNAGLTGRDLLREIMTQKYIALFLNPEIYNDYKRTCLPNVPTYEGLAIPRRFLYGRSERQTNTNVPSPDQQPAFNTNDPVGCQ